MPLLVLILSSCTATKPTVQPVVYPTQTYAPYYVDPAMKPKPVPVQVPESYYSHKPQNRTQFAKPAQPPSGFDFPVPHQKPSTGTAQSLLGLGMALNGMAYGAGPSSPNGAVIMTPGQMPTYYYDNGSFGTLMQPGQMPSYVYPMY